MNIKTLKATRFGRAAVRLLGEEKGAVLMEYVVLGVLILAAVVGIVIVIGNRTADSGEVVIKAMNGQTEDAATAEEAAKTRATQGATDAKARGQRINSGEY